MTRLSVRIVMVVSIRRHAGLAPETTDDRNSKPRPHLTAHGRHANGELT